MIRHLTKAEWLAARKELAEIIESSRHLSDAEPLLVEAQRALTIEGSPTLAGSQLESVADNLRGAPELQERISLLSSKLKSAAFAERDEKNLVTPPQLSGH